MKNLFAIVVVCTLVFSCQSPYPGVPDLYNNLLDSALVKAGDNRAELEKALAETPKEQKEGMAFLISYMPQRDLTSLKADFLLENTEYAYRAREEFSWCRDLPDSIFLNEVLPYANTSEDRDPWRKDFYERFSKYVVDCDNMVDAIFAINRPINKEVGVEYNTKRSKVDGSPKQSMEEHMATCTGLSIILTDAFRSVGIPSRLAGTGMWTNMKGNHTWSEVWVDGVWRFTEYYPDTLDRSWFVADAGKADPDNEIHWIYAVSYKPTGLYYGAGTQAMHLVNQVDPSKIPASWKARIERMKQSGYTLPQAYIHGVNVTDRYIRIYQESMENQTLAADDLMAQIVVFESAEKQESDSRVSCRIDVFAGDQAVDFGYSPLPTDDNNRFLNIRLKKETAYRIVLTNKLNAEETKEEVFLTGSGDQEEIKLFWK